MSTGLWQLWCEYLICNSSFSLFVIIFLEISGQPCCIVEWEIGISALEFAEKLRSKVFNSTTQGGYDDLFTLVSIDPSVPGQLGQCLSKSTSGPLSEGTIPCVLFKGLHTPTGSRMQKYVDEISFAIYERSSLSCVVKALSRTKLVSVNCDGGRNYQNLQNVILNLGILSYVESTLYGCAQRR
jgi:hypothetical protein